jgi:glyoxylase-like metal-dependent hydrolase (beta-lactamase superfamily II)
MRSVFIGLLDWLMRPTYYAASARPDLEQHRRYRCCVDVRELQPRLWQWTAPHPDWKPTDAGPNGWDQIVSSYLWSGGGGLVLFDPIAPAGGTDEAERFWEALDRDVAAHGPPHVLLTIYWHARSAQAVVDRYTGARVWVHAPAAAEARKRTTVTDEFTAGDRLPGGVEALESARSGEILFWLPSLRVLVAGDVLLGTPDGGIRVCPDSWLPRGSTGEALREELRSLLERPVELVLLTHGEPVSAGARDALTSALA